MIKKKKDNISLSQVPQVKSTFRLYRADALGNSTEMTQQDFEDLLQDYP